MFDENDRVVVVVVATNEEHVTVPLILRFRSRVKYGDCIYPFVCIKVTRNASDQKIRKTSETHRRNSSLATTCARDHQKTKNEEEKKNDFLEDDHFCRVSSFSSSSSEVLVTGGKSDAHRSGMFRMSSRGGARLMFRI